MSNDKNTSLEPKKPEQYSFLKKALNRTREAIRNVDEAITFRETFRSIEERFERQRELNIEIEQSMSDLRSLSKEQCDYFEKLSASINETAERCRSSADEAEKLLSEAKARQSEIHKATTEQLTRWQHDSESIKNELNIAKEQLFLLQQSFRQFLISAVVILSLLALAIVYLLVRA